MASILFPTLEEATGMRPGPTQVMRMVHQHMRGVLAQAEDAIERQDTDGALEEGETLLILMQQHNIKEEGILYPMANQHLAAQVEDLLVHMEAVPVP